MRKKYFIFSGQGFTLIEMVLVVIIIGIISALTYPRLAGRSEETRRKAAQSDIDPGLSSALGLYEMDMGKYPDNLEALKAKQADAGNWRGPYIDKITNDPWGRPYLYKFPGEHNPDSYDLSSRGKDGNEGGGDDISNWQ
jgi:general secretion pathway protein G